jgi:hypothetical protein
MKKPFKQVLEEGDFNIYSREVDQKTLEEKVLLAKGGKVIAGIMKKGQVAKEVGVDALDKE